MVTFSSNLLTILASNQYRLLISVQNENLLQPWYPDHRFADLVVDPLFPRDQAAGEAAQAEASVRHRRQPFFSNWW